MEFYPRMNGDLEITQNNRQIKLTSHSMPKHKLTVNTNNKQNQTHDDGNNICVLQYLYLQEKHKSTIHNLTHASTGT